ncbi:glycosyltransferase [Thalassobellus suaedae]|uniref:Glycosyltransferase n=1 Tax=Thalassobellus suaedae TaxID=3074124 RepID=A0ABY9XV10_9FLAO|nr:glycosyltransferase [Flavobacteriaceae bacterium HL-DH14]
MLSIIVCSRTKVIDDNLYENIKNTVGCLYELVIVDNSQNEYSIFEAYNKGIEASKGEYLCFMHDDVLLHTENWGNIIIEIFKENKKIGLLGVAGTTVKTKMPSAWWRCPVETRHVRLIQHTDHSPTEIFELGFKNNSLEQVVVVDGVFMVARKVNEIRFNEHIEGFHNYDLNLSFEYIKHDFQVFVTNKVLIEHFSSGTLNDSWIESTFKIHNIYKDFLPLSVCEQPFIKALEVVNAKKFIKECFKHGQNIIAFLTWLKLFNRAPF